MSDNNNARIDEEEMKIIAIVIFFKIFLNNKRHGMVARTNIPNSTDKEHHQLAQNW